MTDRQSSTPVSDWDRLVNSKWPDSPRIPSDQEAATGAKRIYRKAMGRPWTGNVQIVRGNRHTWIRGRTLCVNPARQGWHIQAGWPEIVHSLSHWAHRRLHPNERPHSNRQLYIERDLADYVLAAGFLGGKLKRKSTPKPKRDLVCERYARILKREASWATKLKRAERALSKVRKERQQYERRHGERLATN